MIEYNCPKCQTAMASPESMAGQNDTCPQCGNVMIVPQVDPAQSATAPGPSPHQTINVNVKGAKAASGLGIAALVLGILACLTCWIPFLGILSIPLSGLGVLFAVIGFLASAIGRRSGIGFPVAGGIVSVVALIIAIMVTSIIGESIERATKLAEDASVKATQDNQPTSGNRAPSDKKIEPKPRSECIITAEFVKAEKRDFGFHLEFKLTNIGDKDIGSVLGGIHIYDQFDQHLDGLKIEQDNPIQAGQTVLISGNWPLYGQRSIKLLRSDRAKIKFKAKQVIYADGTREVIK